MISSSVRLLVLLLICLSPLSSNAQVTVLQKNGVEVTEEDIKRYMTENLPPEERQKTAILNRAGIFTEMVENLYMVRFLAKQMEKTAGFDEAQARWAAEMAYQRKLISQFRNSYVTEKLKDVDWEAAAHEEYKVNPEKYMTPEQVSVSHILVKTEERNEEEALALAEELRERAIEGENFAALATEYSEDSSAKQNQGNLGFFSRGQMVKPFENAAFSMQNPGDISEIVKTPFGYHILFFQGRKPSQQAPFEKVKQQIIEKIQQDRSNQVWQDLIIRIRTDAAQGIDKEAMEQVKEKYQPDMKMPDE